MGILFNGGGKSKRDRQFELLDSRLTDIQGRLAKLVSRLITFEGKVNSQMSELNDAVQSIKDDVVRIGSGVKGVLALLTQPTPDVTNAVAALKEADAGLDAAAEAMEAALNPPAAPPAG